jgi:hypothetical protein
VRALGHLLLFRLTAGAGGDDACTPSIIAKVALLAARRPVASPQRDRKAVDMFDKAMKKSVEAYLEPGETVLNVSIVQGKGMSKTLLAGGAIGAAAVGALRDRKARAEGGDAEVELSSKMGIAVTDRRLLIFKAGGAVTLSAKELLSAVPIADVDSLEVGKGVLTRPVTFTVRGTPFQAEAPKAVNTDKLVSAFQQAKAQSAVSA